MIKVFLSEIKKNTKTVKSFSSRADFCLTAFIKVWSAEKKYCLWFPRRWVDLASGWFQTPPITERDDEKKTNRRNIYGNRGPAPEQSPGLSSASVREALAGFLPATGGAPALSVLHPVDFATLFGLAARPPAEHRQPWGNGVSTLDPRLHGSHLQGALCCSHCSPTLTERAQHAKPWGRGGEMMTGSLRTRGQFESSDTFMSKKQNAR